MSPARDMAAATAGKRILEPRLQSTDHPHHTKWREARLFIVDLRSAPRNPNNRLLADGRVRCIDMDQRMSSIDASRWSTVSPLAAGVIAARKLPAHRCHYSS